MKNHWIFGAVIWVPTIQGKWSFLPQDIYCKTCSTTVLNSTLFVVNSEQGRELQNSGLSCNSDRTVRHEVPSWTHHSVYCNKQRGSKLYPLLGGESTIYLSGISSTMLQTIPCCLVVLGVRNSTVLFPCCEVSPACPYKTIALKLRWICSIGGMILTGETKYTERNLSQCHLADHKSHTDWPGFELRHGSTV